MGLPWKQNQRALCGADQGFHFKTSLLHTSLVLGMQPRQLNLQLGNFSVFISSNLKETPTVTAKFPNYLFVLKECTLLKPCCKLHF